MVKGIQAEWGTCSCTVSCDRIPYALAHWKDLVVVGFDSGNIITVDAITGVHTSVLSSHTKQVTSLTFSLDGTFLVSGSYDNTVNLWDIQTSGVIKTFYGHTRQVNSVSISQNCAMIASGSTDKTIHLWDVQTGECCCIIGGHNDWVSSVSFSPTNSQFLISASHNNTVQQWDIDGHQIGSTYEGRFVAFSSDGTYFVSWGGPIATVRDSHLREVVAELQSPNNNIYCCCFSPDGKFVAGVINQTIYIWDITGLAPCLIETFAGHTQDVTSLIFSSSLISSSWDESVNFWQVGALSTDLGAIDSGSTPLTSVKIRSVSLQATDGIAISSDEDGVVKIWGILTGLCKASFQTPARDYTKADTQLIEGRLTFVWLEDGKIHIWDLEKGESLQVLDIQSTEWPYNIRISADGSKFFLLYEKSIQAWSIQTGEVVGKVMLEGNAQYDSLFVEGSQVWVLLEDLQTHGWDFGPLGSTPIPLLNSPIDRPHFYFARTGLQSYYPYRIKDIVTRKQIFQLPERYARPLVVQWDGRYLITGYSSGEVLILDLYYIISSRCHGFCRLVMSWTQLTFCELF